LGLFLEIFFFCVLNIEDVELFVLKVYAEEAILTLKALLAVFKVRTFPAVVAKIGIM